MERTSDVDTVLRNYNATIDSPQEYLPQDGTLFNWEDSR